MSDIVSKMIIDANKKQKVVHCDCDIKKPIEVFCIEDKVFSCSNCALKNVKNFEQIKETGLE